MKILRNDQLELRNKIYTEWNAGKKNVLAVLPTGGGKTVTFSSVVKEGDDLKYNQAVMVHRNELVNQISMSLADFGIQHRLIAPVNIIAQITRNHRDEFKGKSFINPSSRCSVVGVDTLISRKEQFTDWGKQIHRWVGDEAHHILRENKWGKATELFPNAYGLGVTATPLRADGMGLGREYDGVFDSMVEGPNMRWLINNGHLSDYEIVCPKSDLELTEDDITASGDYSQKKMKEAARKSKIVGDVVEAYCKYAYGLKGICFATDVETSNDIAKKFCAVGIRAVSLSAKTPSGTRDSYIKQYRNGQIQMLVNVDLFDEGFDVPDCSVVIMARPTASYGKYKQMVGRGLRASLGKLYGLIIDHVSNVLRHGLPDKVVQFTLARRDKKAKQTKDPEYIELKECENCTKPYELFHKSCPYCKFEPPLPEPRSRTVEMVKGDLILLDRAKLEQMRRNTVLAAPADVAERVSAVAGRIAGMSQARHQVDKIAAQKELADSIALWAGYQRLKSRSDEESYKRFYLTTGEDVLTALNNKKSRQEYLEMADKIKQWCGLL